MAYDRGGVAMAKVEGERVAIVTDSITLKAIPLLLVGDAESQESARQY